MHVFAWRDRGQGQLGNLDRWQIFQTMNREIHLIGQQRFLNSLRKNALTTNLRKRTSIRIARRGQFKDFDLVSMIPQCVRSPVRLPKRELTGTSP